MEKQILLMIMSFLHRLETLLSGLECKFIKVAFRSIGSLTWASRILVKVFDLRKKSSSMRFLFTDSRIFHIFIAWEYSAFCKEQEEEKQLVKWIQLYNIVKYFNKFIPRLTTWR